MSKRFPEHPDFPLVLRLFRFGKEGENQPIKSTSRLVRESGVSYPTIKKWKDEGWLDLDMEIIAKIVRGEITPAEVEKIRGERVGLEDFIGDKEGVDDADDDLLDEGDDDDDDEELIEEEVEKKSREDIIKKQAKNEAERKLLNDLYMAESEIANNIKSDEDIKGRKIPTRVTMVEFPASDAVYHDIRFYERGPSAYSDKNHNEFMKDQVARLRNIIDMGSSQLEGLVREGRIGSKSAVNAANIVKEGLSMISRFHKEVSDSEGAKTAIKLTPEQRRERRAQRKEDMQRARQEADRSMVNKDELVAKSSSRLEAARREARDRAVLGMDDGDELEE